MFESTEKWVNKVAGIDGEFGDLHRQARDSDTAEAASLKAVLDAAWQCANVEQRLVDYSRDIEQSMQRLRDGLDRNVGMIPMGLGASQDMSQVIQLSAELTARKDALLMLAKLYKDQHQSAAA